MGAPSHPPLISTIPSSLGFTRPLSTGGILNSLTDTRATGTQESLAFLRIQEKQQLGHSPKALLIYSLLLAA